MARLPPAGVPRARTGRTDSLNPACGQTPTHVPGSQGLPGSCGEAEDVLAPSAAVSCPARRNGRRPADHLLARPRGAGSAGGREVEHVTGGRRASRWSRGRRWDGHGHVAAVNYGTNQATITASCLVGREPVVALQAGAFGGCCKRTCNETVHGWRTAQPDSAVSGAAVSRRSPDRQPSRSRGRSAT